MNQLQVKAFENEMFGNMHGYVSDGTAYLNVEESAFGLGFTAVDKSGYEKIAWALLNRVLKNYPGNSQNGRVSSAEYTCRTRGGKTVSTSSKERGCRRLRNVRAVREKAG